MAYPSLILHTSKRAPSFLPSHPSLSLFSDRLRVRFERGGHGEWLSCAVPLAAEEEEVVTDVRDKEEEEGEDS